MCHLLTDDHSTFLSLDGLVNPRIASKIHALDINVKRPLKLLLGYILRRLVGVAPARIVHEDVASSEFLYASRHSSSPVCAFCDVHFVKGQGCRVGSYCGFTAGLIDIANQHFGSFCCECFGYARAEA
jgi:hypothetical protein